MNRGLSGDLRDRLGEFTPDRYTVVETSYIGLRPGDLIEFSYGYVKGRRYGIILKTDAHFNGIFLSTLGNSLYNVLTCESLDEDIFLSLLNTMYGDESKSTYAEAVSIAPLNPPENAERKKKRKRQPKYDRSVRDFRTLNISGLSDIFKITFPSKDT
tara:strand:+ start:300 stop:770 length:471 start_codon:yes stop_codon:yes gene_type:complete